MDRHGAQAGKLTGIDRHYGPQYATASAAGRAMFATSRLEKKSSNDADRLSKYLARFSLRFEDIKKPG
ncbi:sigma54-dependent transcriptional activator domain-containing protein (plasmid) [Rhizobium sp. TAL182]|nr:sigma54-dependent transcriptional activator domain-containing protein [Rhizobium sp. TAL182]